MTSIVWVKKVLFYKDENEIGSAEIYRNDDGMGYLCNFNIYTEYRGKGYGQEFLKELIEKHGVRMLDVDDYNEKAIHIYKKFGFEETGHKTIQMKLKEETK